MCINTQWVMGRKDDRVRLFRVVSSEGTGGNVCTLKYMKFHLSIAQTFVTVKMIEHWNQSCGVSILRDIQNSVKMSLRNLL